MRPKLENSISVDRTGTNSTPITTCAYAVESIERYDRIPKRRQNAQAASATILTRLTKPSSRQGNDVMSRLETHQAARRQFAANLHTVRRGDSRRPGESRDSHDQQNDILFSFRSTSSRCPTVIMPSRRRAIKIRLTRRAWLIHRHPSRRRHSVLYDNLGGRRSGDDSLLGPTDRRTDGTQRGGTVRHGTEPYRQRRRRRR